MRRESGHACGNGDHFFSFVIVVPLCGLTCFHRVRAVALLGRRLVTSFPFSFASFSFCRKSIIIVTVSMSRFPIKCGKIADRQLSHRRNKLCVPRFRLANLFDQNSRQFCALSVVYCYGCSPSCACVFSLFPSNRLAIGDSPSILSVLLNSSAHFILFHFTLALVHSLLSLPRHHNDVLFPIPSLHRLPNTLLFGAYLHL